MFHGQILVQSLVDSRLQMNGRAFVEEENVKRVVSGFTMDFRKSRTSAITR